ncbi:MAG: RNA polymerase sigma factor [Labilithrix sp.]|nr:RNA polymerase sigma factor [Labilithrix sp.]MCW5812489.1 RNA polymerase sigma factor [Labilithrix sp.]
MTAREAELDEWMARLARGDRSAFDPLYAGLRPRAARVVARHVAPSRAEDVLQSALMNVFARASEFTPGRPCLPWFYAVVANEVRAARRRDARLVLGDPPPDALVDDDDPESLLARRELERSIELAIDALDTEAANAILALLGRAPLPDLPAPTVRKRVSRAYGKLRLLLRGHDAR